MKTLIKHHHFGILLFVIVALSGCVLPFPGSVPNIAYCGRVPQPITIGRQETISFCREFAAETGMVITFISPESTSYGSRSTYVSCESPNGITARISGSEKQDAIEIMVFGDPSSPVTKTFANKGVELFQKKYPEGRIAQSTLKRTLF